MLVYTAVELYTSISSEVIIKNCLVSLMKEWDKIFTNLETIDFSYGKNVKRLRTGSFFNTINKNDLILDVFSGRCDTSYGLKDLGYRIVSGDISLELLKINKGVNRKLQCSALVLPFRNDQFDAVIIQGGLHHLDSFDHIQVCLNEIKRIVKPTGSVFISEPGNTLAVKIWLFLIKKTTLWKVTSYSRNWHDLYKAEEKTHSLNMSNIKTLTSFLKHNWIIAVHKRGLVTEFITLKKE